MPKLASRLGKVGTSHAPTVSDSAALKIALGLLNSPSMPLSSTTEMKSACNKLPRAERQWSQATREGAVVLMLMVRMSGWLGFWTVGVFVALGTGFACVYL